MTALRKAADVGPRPIRPSSAVLGLAAEAFEQRRIEYEARAKADRAHKACFAAMQQEGVEAFSFELRDGRTVDALIEAAEVLEIDVAELRRVLAGKPALFLRCVKASIGTVAYEAGGEVARLATRTVVKPAALRIKGRK